jgi:hypothetical protein
MKLVSAGVFAAVLLSSAAAQADSFGINGAFATSGFFTCREGVPCSGTGTNSVTLGSGSNMATVTFNGVDTTVVIGNVSTPVSLGQFVVSSTPGFVFPIRPNNPFSILRFDFTIHHTTPTDDANSLRMTFGPGGKSYLQELEGQSFTTFPLFETSPGRNYPAFVYSFTPYPVRLLGDGITDFSANVGAVPEPATMFLVGGGLAAAIARRRKRAVA